MKEVTTKEPRKSIKEIIYNKKRNKVLSQLTGNLGEVIETEDKIICYVDKNNCKQESFSYIIPCSGIMTKDKAIAEKYGLNKPICYVIDGFELNNKKIYIFGHKNCEIIIKNSNFSNMLFVNVDGKCTLENSHINNQFVFIYAKDLIIKDTIIKSTFNTAKESRTINISISADDNIEINNSSIGDERLNVKIKNIGQLHIYNSKIIGNIVNCKAERIRSTPKSWLIANENLKINSIEFSNITVYTPNLNCNDTTFTNLTTPMILKKTKDMLKTKKLELLAILNEIKNIVSNKNEEELKKYQITLENKPIRKILTKN